MTKRILHYDNTEDAVRLTRDWTIVGGGGTWSVQYDAVNRRFFYRLTGAVGFEQLILKSVQVPHAIDVKMLFRSSNVSEAWRIGIKGGSDVEANHDIHVAVVPGNIYTVASSGGVYETLDTTPDGIAYTVDTWWWGRVQFAPSWVKCKLWGVNDPEPDWTTYVYYPEIITNRTWSKVGHGYFVIKESGIGTRDVSDIRIIPIPKYGGGTV